MSYAWLDRLIWLSIVTFCAGMLTVPVFIVLQRYLHVPVADIFEPVLYACFGLSLLSTVACFLVSALYFIGVIRILCPICGASGKVAILSLRDKQPHTETSGSVFDIPLILLDWFACPDCGHIRARGILFREYAGDRKHSGDDPGVR
jgi:hypothetical protein